jgi:hypothetical protein
MKNKPLVLLEKSCEEDSDASLELLTMGYDERLQLGPDKNTRIVHVRRGLGLATLENGIAPKKGFNLIVGYARKVKPGETLRMRSVAPETSVFVFNSKPAGS